MPRKKSKYDIFVSYRRDGGYETALPIVEKLRSAGYRIFFDLESMNAGKFNEQLIDVIDGARDFILVLPAHGLDRCESPDDWVRREVARAIEKGKNIVPVMLKGFEWPDNLPADIAELPNYQGISASSPEHFDMAVERLKGYLVSRRRMPIRRWLTVGGVCTGILMALAFVLYVAFRQLAKPACTEAGTRITMAMNAMHRMSEVTEDFNRAWESYLDQRSGAARGSRPMLDSNMVSDIESSYIPAIEELRSSFPAFTPLGSYDKFLLGLYDVDAADIDGLGFVIGSEADQCKDLFDVCRNAIAMDMLSTSSRNAIRQGNEAERYGMNMLYYRYLELLSRMPSTAWASHKVSAPGWHLYPTVSESLDASEYARLADIEQTKMEKAIVPLQSFVEMLVIKNNRLEEYLDDMNHVLEDSVVPEAVARRTTEQADARAAALERVERKRGEVEEMRRSLTDAERKLREQYDGFKAKYTIEGQEDQYLKWGKICHIASYLDKTVHFNKERRAIGVEPTITDAEVLQYLESQLDAYTRQYPGTKIYTDAAKAFYAEVAAGSRRADALIMMGTQHDLPHPLLHIGDIIVERNGVTRLPDMKALSEAAKKDTPGTIRLLRLDGSRLREIACDFPHTDVKIGLLQLKD